MKDRIISLLGQGVPATQVAAHVGCDDSYISQLLQDEEIVLQVQQLKAENFGVMVEHDRKIDSVEQKLLNRLETLSEFITKPSEAARVFSILNAAKRKTADAQATSAAPSTIVQLTLPESARVQFTVTQDRQVIEVEGRSMTTMPARSLAKQLEERNAAKLLATPIPSVMNLGIPSKLLNKL